MIFPFVNLLIPLYHHELDALALHTSHSSPFFTEKLIITLLLRFWIAAALQPCRGRKGLLLLQGLRTDEVGIMPVLAHCLTWRFLEYGVHQSAGSQICPARQGRAGF